MSRGWSICVGAGRGEARAGEHTWYGDGGIGGAVRTGQGEEVGAEVGVREVGVSDA